MCNCHADFGVFALCVLWFLLPGRSQICPNCIGTHRSTAHILERILTVDLIMPVSMPEGAVRFRDLKDFERYLKVFEGLEFCMVFAL